MVPRRLPLTGTPTRITYSERLDKLIVIYTITIVNAISQTGSRRDRSQRRILKPALAFIDPNSDTPRAEVDEVDEMDDLNVLQATDVKAGERYLGVMEWFPTDGSRQYHMLVINTIIGQAASEDATGRLLLFVPGMSDDNEVTVDLKKSVDRDDPVWCVASYGRSSLIYACGDELVLQPLNMGARCRLGTEVTVTLHCPATHISVDERLIHVSTKGSGHHIFTWKRHAGPSLCRRKRSFRCSSPNHARKFAGDDLGS